MKRSEFIISASLLGTGAMLNPRILSASNRAGNFLENIGVCTGLDHHEILAKEGYSYIEAGVGGFLMPDKPREDFENMLNKLNRSRIPVKVCNLFIPGRLKSTGPSAVVDDILRYVKIAFQRAQQAGVEIIVFGSGGSRKIPDGFSRDKARRQFVELNRKMAPVAKKYNVIVALEPLNSRECNFINSVTEGAGIVMDVDHSNFRLLADIYHMMVDGEKPESIEQHGHLLVHTHIAEKEGRTPPGVNGEDFTSYFKALKETGYKGAMSIEGRWEDMEAQAGRAIQAIREQVQKV